MKEYNFRCTGMIHRKKDLKEIEVENPDFDIQYSDLKDLYEPYEKIFKYEYPVSTLSFEFETDNEYDPNAVKVLADGHHIAYIKKEKCTQVKNLLKSPLLKNVTVDIGGGPYKIIKEVEGKYGDPVLRVFRDELPLWVHLTFYVEEKKKFCTQCGKQVDPASKFCTFCGCKL